jgi:hypothetical protein
MRKILNTLAGFSLLAMVAAGLSAPKTVSAQAATTFSIESVGEQVGLGDADLKTTVINILRWVLGFMTLIAVVFIIYGGFIWLTAVGTKRTSRKPRRSFQLPSSG